MRKEEANEKREGKKKKRKHFGWNLKPMLQRKDLSPGERTLGKGVEVIEYFRQAFC